MSHEITINATGDAEMFYSGRTPWHGLGTRLDHPATAAEAIKAAHLDWEVESCPIYTGTELQPKIKVPGYQAIRRSDTGKVLSVKSNRYEILQNAETWGFADVLIANGDANYHTAGSLRDGRVIWILADSPITKEVVADDPVEMYLLLTTSHDGSLALQITTTPIRVVCANTLRAAFASHKSEAQITIRHTSTMRQRMAAAEQAFAVGKVYFEYMIGGAQEMARTPMSDKDMSAFARAILKVDPDGSRKISHISETAISNMEELFVSGKGQDNPRVRGTAWAAYNAVTEFVDYDSHVQKIGDESQSGRLAQDRRLHRSWFGQGQAIRNKAWHLLGNYRRQGASALVIPGGS